MGYTVHHQGAFPEPPICNKITWKITQPWTYLEDEGQLATMRKIQEATKKLAKPDVAARKLVTSEVASPQKAVAQEPPNWYVFKDSVQYGPLNQSVITEWLREGKVKILILFGLRLSVLLGNE